MTATLIEPDEEVRSPLTPAEVFRITAAPDTTMRAC
jgi:hypothetical protein